MAAIEQTQAVPTQLYEVDYLQWLETTVAQLRSQAYPDVDWVHVIEEIEDMGKRERRSLKSNLIVVLLHLLKWQFQPERRSGSWESSLLEHRRRIRETLADSPSLLVFGREVLADAYGQAIKQAKAETGLPLNRFPQACPYGIEAILDDDFLPA